MGSSAGTGSALPVSRFGGRPVFPRTPRIQDRRPGARLSSNRSGLPCVPAEARWRLPSRAPLQGGLWFAASNVRLATRRPKLSPPGLWSSTALPARRIRDRLRLRDVAAAPPHPRETSSLATFRPRRLWRCTLSRTPSTPSTACSPPCLPSRLAATRNAPEVPPSGPCSSPGIGASLEARALLRVSPAGVAAKRHPRSPASEPCSPQGIRTAWDRTPVAAVALLTFQPFKALYPRRLHPASRARLPRASSPRSCERSVGAPEHLPRRDRRFLVAEAPAFLGFLTSSKNSRSLSKESRISSFR